MGHVTDRVIGDVLEGLEHAGTCGQQHEQLPHSARQILCVEVQLLTENTLQEETHWIGYWVDSVWAGSEAWGRTLPQCYAGVCRGWAV